jgi:TonB-dependent receptor
MKIKSTLAAIAGWFALALAPVTATRAANSTLPTGTVEGRVLNATSGAYLNNARLTVPGTTLEAFTGESGDFRLAPVPAGEAKILVTFTGLQAQAATVTVASGSVVRRDFNLTRTGSPAEPRPDGVTQLDPFLVATNREMNAADIASQEQRYAPNIKNVVAADAFGDAGEGNLGEFIKFIPGVTVNYSGFDARTISVRGLPSYTTPVMVDGNRMSSAASSGVTRDVEVGGLIMNNISRVEVSKTPTPDSPADSMGGTVNVISKGAFDRSKPQFSYRLNAVMNSLWLTFKELPGGQPETNGRRILPGGDFSYVAPFSKTFGITINGFYTERYSGTQASQPTWRPVNGASAFGTVTNPFLSGHSYQDSPTFWRRQSLGTSLDWKIGRKGMLTVGGQITTTDVWQNIEQFTTSLTGTSNVRPQGYDYSYALSAPGAASAVITTNARRKTDRNVHTSLAYRYDGSVWKFDAGGSYSHAQNGYRDIDFGFFSAALLRTRNLTLRYSDINAGGIQGPLKISATNTAGAPFNLYSIDGYSLQTSSSGAQSSADTVMTARANVRRDFLLNIPFTLRTGFNVRQQDRDIRTNAGAWTFVGPDRVANTADDLASRYDVLDTNYSGANAPFHQPPTPRASPYKLWQLYQAHPEYFTFDQVAKVTSTATGSRKLIERVSAGYLRADTRLFRSRLLLVGGVRYEFTADEGYGLKNDVRATYQQDASGNLLRNAAGAPLRIPGDALTIARTQYVDRGSHAVRDYGNVYPSFNSTWQITENFQARAAFAKTIGRPNLNEIIPSMTVTDPTATTDNRTITVTNTGLRPWNADNFDLSLEYYFSKGGRATFGAFKKNIHDFFGATRTRATVEQLAEFGLNDDYLDYTIVTKNNVGDARVTGIDFEFQQPLTFLPNWARGVVAQFNLTESRLGGGSTADFTGFTRETINWGFSLNRPRYNVKLNWNYRGIQRLGAVTGAGIPEGTYTYNAPFLTLNVNAEYRITRRLGAYVTIRNIGNTGQVVEIYSKETPKHARVDNYQNLGSQISLGIKGEF